MIQWNLSKETAKTLINFIDHFYISTIDIDQVEDEIQKRDLKIAYLESCNRMQSITSDEEDALLKSLDEFRQMTIKEYEAVDDKSAVSEPVVE